LSETRETLPFITGDRVYLERTEAKEMLYNYNDQTARNGSVESRKWVEARIAYLGKIYGNGFDGRVRGYMRELADMEIKNVA
jgi:hypothetical protein